ncbi:MAG: 3-phosphoshikimate 1-carboxyvinyltransferase [Spirochaetia bacterium]|nr:3-phosphoshikimate 1-carboxyvinyltransferase [Spirochaetia bacterium]
MTVVRERMRLAGNIEAPPSKSLSQRAIACAVLAEGKSRIRASSLCADAESALRVAHALQATVDRRAEWISIRGSLLFRELAAQPLSGQDDASLDLDCGESGLCMRMFSPIAALLPKNTRLLASGSLSARPMAMIEEPLKILGADCRTTEGRAPITIKGPMRGGLLAMNAGGSSQFLTGLLLALPLAAEDSEILVRATVSRGYLDLTIAAAKAFGVTIERDDDYSRFNIAGRQRYKAAEYEVEGDWSSAAFLVVAAALAAADEGVVIRGLDKGSQQPDSAVLDAAAAAGTRLEFGQEGLRVGRAALEPFSFDATDCPDLFPPLAALASACPGSSEIRGVSRLRGKESDRAASIMAMLTGLGIESKIQGDSLIIYGDTPAGGRVQAWGDHRIAMAAAVAALAAEAPVAIDGAECVAKSWPNFFQDLDSLRI